VLAVEGAGLASLRCSTEWLVHSLYRMNWTPTTPIKRGE
jgi:hypothetical protein